MNCFDHIQILLFLLLQLQYGVFLYQSHELAKLEHVDRLHIAHVSRSPVSSLQPPDQSIETGESVQKKDVTIAAADPTALSVSSSFLFQFSY